VALDNLLGSLYFPTRLLIAYVYINAIKDLMAKYVEKEIE